MKTIFGVLLAGALSLGATASAALTFDFLLPDDDDTPRADHPSSLSYTVDGVTLNVEAAYSFGTGVGTVERRGYLDYWADPYYAQTGDGWGLGINGTSGSYIDQSKQLINARELLILNFSHVVKLTSLKFQYNDFEDDVSIYEPSEHYGGELTEGWVLALPDPLISSTLRLDGSWGGAGRHFGIGAGGARTEFRLASIDVELVPAPAAWLLLPAALAGFALIRRKAA